MTDHATTADARHAAKLARGQAFMLTTTRVHVTRVARVTKPTKRDTVKRWTEDTITRHMFGTEGAYVFRFNNDNNEEVTR